MVKALSLLFLVALGAPSPRVHAVSVPRHALKGVPYRVVLAVSPPARGTLRASGPKTLSVPLRPMKQRGRYQATVRFPFAGSWRLAATVGRRTTRLGSGAAAVPRAPPRANPLPLS